jgi:hypothetical protein
MLLYRRCQPLLRLQTHSLLLLLVVMVVARLAPLF